MTFRGAPLPIDAHLPRVVEALRAGPAVVVVASPGAGKSTRVPLAVLEHVAPPGLTLMLEPRRAAARLVARRLAWERGEAEGGVVGWQVRHEAKKSRDTRLLVITEGILTRRFVDDPFLEGVGCVILDELHERSVHVDLALAFLRELMDARDDLKIVAMSATMDAAGVAAFFGGCPIVEAEGRVFPLTVSHRGERLKGDPAPAVAAGVRALLADPADDGGDVLAFLPGAGEIHRALDLLTSTPLPGAPRVLPLYGALPAEAQDAALSRGPGPRPGRRIVLATNIAETSLTLDGVTAVVDAGLARVMRFDHGAGIDRLETVPISLSSATQRAGRAGRQAPGRVLRLWSVMDHQALAPADAPELHRVDLAPVLLTVLGFQPGDPRRLRWFDPPSDAAVEAALTLLTRLGALEPAGLSLTPRGQALARLPVHPRVGAVLLRAAALGQPEAGALAAALLEERDLLRPADAGRAPTTASDLTWRMDVYHHLRAAHFRPEEARRWGADAGAARAVQKVAESLTALARGLPRGGGARLDAEEAVGRALLAGFPDRLCRRRRPGEPEALMVGGAGMRLDEGSGVREAELFLALDVEAGRRGRHSAARVFLASAVEEGWLGDELPEGPQDVVVARFDPETQAVVGVRERRCLDLVLSERRGVKVDDASAAAALAEAASPPDAWARVFRPSAAAQRLLYRIRLAAQVLPEDDWPEVSDAALKALLPALCLGRRSFADLTGIDWGEVLRGQLSWKQGQVLDAELPERITVPSGSQITLDWDAALAEGGAPVLAVRLQEVFGLAETPRLARGRLGVVLHLLSPGYRPVQVTRDLRSFWDQTYPEVRKELRPRYPKHSWPDDPWTAEAVRGARRRT